MISIDYPLPEFKIKNENDKRYIFDAIRKVWLRLTEEEWVRQNFVSFLIRHKLYPATSFALEKELMLNDLKKRFDVLVYNKRYEPWMLIECKAPTVTLNTDVLQQVLRYNMSIPVQYLLITNGNNTYGWKKGEGELIEIKEIPLWQ